MMPTDPVVMFEGEAGDREAIEGLVTAQLHICHGLWIQGGDLPMGDLPATAVAWHSRELEASRAETMAQINTCRWW